MSTGFVLNIPQEMLNRLEDADKKIEKLARTSEDAQTRIVSAFKSINTHGIDAFINKLTEAQTTLANLGNTKVDFSANASIFSSLTSNARKAIDEVNDVVSAIGKIKTASGETGKMQNPFLGSGISEALAKLNAEIEQAKRNFSELQNQFTHLNVPAGDKSNLTNIQNEAQFLMEYIRVLEKEKNGLIAAKNALAEANKTLQQKDPFKAKVDDLSRESLEALRYKDSMQAMKEFYAEQDKERKKAAKEAEADRKKREKEEKATAERIATYDSKARRERYKAYTSTYEGAMRTSDRAKTLLQEQQAIKNLEAARSKLNKTDSDYENKLRNLNQRILEHKNNIDKATAGSKNLQKQHRSLMDISGQLARRLALVFSVSQITGYVKKLIEVRGEFELQQRSLQAILQNKDEANRIWQQTVDLAVRSPFRVKELVSYTKQLAAYRIESDKLFETNKMLADISAGLGVDMQRLILAFGQVRSAAYLRGTELRQFTEAGIPILEQLAQYFTELEGRAVSVGDVFERVSKRMVSFADVEEIFKRMTSEGGTFYRMQEIQAETLQGQISNLKDSVDIMLNDIGKAHQDTLASSVAFVRSVVQNWRLLATAIQQAGFALAGFSAVKIIRALRLTGDALVEATIKARGLTAATAKLKLSMMDLGKWIKAHPAFFAVGLIASATHALIQYGKSVDAMNEKYDEMSQRELRRVDTLKELNEQAQKNNQAIKDAIAEQDNASEGTDEYATAEDNLSRARGKNISLLERLKKEYPEVYASITKQEDGTVDLTKAIEEQNRVAQRQIALQQQAKGGWFQESLTKNYEDAVEALGNYQSSLDEVAIATYEMRQNLSMALSSEQITQEEYDAISSIADRMMDIKDSVEGLNLIEEIFGTKAMSNAEISALVEPIRHALVELGETVPEYNWALGDFFDNLENLKSLPVTINEMVALDPEKGKENAGDYVESVLDEFGIVNDTIREWAKRKIEKIIGFKLVWGDGEGGGGDEELDGWAKRVKEAVDALNEEIKKKSPKIDTDDLFPVPNKNQTKEEYLSVAKDAIGVAEMTYDELQKIEDQEVVDRTKALSPFVETFRKILNLYKETTKDDGDKDTFTPMLRSVKEIYSEFKKLQGSFDDLTAKEGALAKFGDAFKEAFDKTPEQMGFDLFSEEGVKAAYDYLISKAPDAKKKIQAQLAKGEIVWDVKLQTKKDADKELLDDIQELFDQYDLSLELKKLNIPPDLAKSLFDVDYLDLKGLKENVINEFSGTSEALKTELQKGFGNIDWLTVKNLSSGELMEAIKKALKDIDDLEEKQQLESAKRFAKFLTQNLDQTKVVLQQRGIDIAFAKKEFDEGRISAEQFVETVKNISAQANEEISKINLDKFKESPEYIMAMGDMSAYADKKLEELLKTLRKVVAENSRFFSADEAKAYAEAIAKAEKELGKRKKGIFVWEEFDKVKEILSLEKKIQKQKEIKQEFDQKEIEQKEQLYILEQKLLTLETQKKAIESGAVGGETAKVMLDNINAQIAQTTQGIQLGQQALAAIQGGANGAAAALGSLGGQLGQLIGGGGGGGASSTLAIIDAIIHAINDTVQGIKELSEEIGALLDSFGKDTSFSSDFGKFQKAWNTFAESSQAATDGWEALKSGDMAGMFVNQIKSVTSIIRGVNEYIDEGLNVAIETHLEDIEALQRDYEKLEWAIDRALSLEKYGMVAEQQENLAKQIENTQKAIAAEEDKKDTDKDRIEELQGEIEEASKQIQELYDNLRADIVGTFEDLSSTLGDAMISALQQGEDALKAWSDSVNDIITDIFGQLLIQKYLEPQIANLVNDYYGKIMPKNARAENKYQEYLKAIERGDTATAEKLIEEYKKLAEQAIGEVPQINEDATKQFQSDLLAAGENFKDLIPDWLINSTKEGGGLSALTKGISGMSEQQAEILSAYWNSVRGYTASIDSKMDLVLANLGAGAEDNPMLEQMRLVAKNTSAINTLLSSLVKGGHSQGGQGLKVFMD